jgi:flagellar biosynthetic protein FliO
MLQPVLAIVLVLGLLIGTLLVLQRRGLARLNMALPRNASRARQMQVLERLSLTPQHSLHLVQVKGQIFVVGVSPSGCSRLARYIAAEPAPALGQQP